MWESVLNWFYTNAAAIFISAFASLLISKYYFYKANRDGVLSTIIFPIVRILEKVLIVVKTTKNYLELIPLILLNILKKMNEKSCSDY